LATKYDRVEHYNFLALELAKIYKRYSKPYNLGYHSANKFIDLSNNYKFKFCFNTLNSNYTLSQGQTSPVAVFGLVPERSEQDFQRILSLRGGVNLIEVVWLFIFMS